MPAKISLCMQINCKHCSVVNYTLNYLGRILLLLGHSERAGDKGMYWDQAVQWSNYAREHHVGASGKPPCDNGTTKPPTITPNQNLTQGEKWASFQVSDVAPTQQSLPWGFAPPSHYLTLLNTCTTAACFCSTPFTHWH